MYRNFITLFVYFCGISFLHLLSLICNVLLFLTNQWRQTLTFQQVDTMNFAGQSTSYIKSTLHACRLDRYVYILGRFSTRINKNGQRQTNEQRENIDSYISTVRYCIVVISFFSGKSSVMNIQSVDVWVVPFRICMAPNVYHFIRYV